MKHFLFRLLGKDPEAVVVSFCSGPRDLALRMVEEIRQLVPGREHYAVSDEAIPGVITVHPADLPGPLKRKRIGLAPVLLTGEPEHRPLRRAAFRFAPTKLLAYNKNLERHHLKLRTLIASLLFVKGVPLDRIWLRPWWLFPFKRERSVWPSTHTVHEGRPVSSARRRIAILSPYFPYPLSHGGAVRIYNLMREASRDFDIFLFSFAEKTSAPEGTPVLQFCAKTITFPDPRYREPRWASLRPPEVNEFYSPYVARVLEEQRRVYQIPLVQVEYTQMARYKGDILVEHDVTFDLYEQIVKRGSSAGARWNLWRWVRFERAAARRFPAVVAMSDKDAAMLGGDNVHVIPNGVDLSRFSPQPESNDARILFVGSFAHFPNVVAYRWFLDEVWPLVTARIPEARFTVIAGRNPHLYCSDLTPSDPRVEFHGFISDVRPYYEQANVVVVPTRVSAGTNLKVLEAMAAERAVVSTESGCAGLGVVTGETAWIADTPDGFADAVVQLLSDFALRTRFARAGRKHVEMQFGWDRIAVSQRKLWLNLLNAPGVRVRRGTQQDLPAITHIQKESHGASTWEPSTYFSFDVHVAERRGVVAGFMVSRVTAPDEAEVLNLAVAVEARRTGIGAALIEVLDQREVFLEVRESNVTAQALYRKLGFRVVGERNDYYDDPVETAFIMRRSRA